MLASPRPNAAENRLRRTVDIGAFEKVQTAMTDGSWSRLQSRETMDGNDPGNRRGHGRCVSHHRGQREFRFDDHHVRPSLNGTRSGCRWGHGEDSGATGRFGHHDRENRDPGHGPTKHPIDGGCGVFDLNGTITTPARRSWSWTCSTGGKPEPWTISVAAVRRILGAVFARHPEGTLGDHRLDVSRQYEVTVDGGAFFVDEGSLSVVEFHRIKRHNRRATVAGLVCRWPT